MTKMTLQDYDEYDSCKCGHTMIQHVLSHDAGILCRFCECDSFITQEDELENEISKVNKYRNDLESLS